MEITETFISELENYASLMFTRKEISIILEVDPLELKKILKDLDSAASRAFQRGRLKR